MSIPQPLRPALLLPKGPYGTQAGGLMRVHRFIQSTVFAIGLIAAAAAAAAAAHAQAVSPEPSTATSATAAAPLVPLAGASAELSAIRGDLDAATARAVQLEAEIAAVEADNRAIGERLAVTAIRIVDQRAATRQAEERLAAAEARYRTRLVEVYKRSSFDPFTLLLSSDTLNELVSRADALSRIAEDDSRVVADLNIAAADARYQEATLADLQSQDRVLRNEQEERLAALSGMLSEQEVLIDQLTDEAREALLQARRFTSETRQQWRLASIPIGTTIPRATATVDARPGELYAISAYMPRQYLTSGKTFTAVSSWYGPGFNGRGSASGQVFNEDDYTAASRTLPFGTVLALTRGDRRVIVYVNDRGPYIAGRDLDLSKAAASALGFGGVATIQVEIVAPAP